MNGETLMKEYLCIRYDTNCKKLKTEFEESVSKVKYIAPFGTRNNPKFVLSFCTIAQTQKLVIWNRHSKTLHCKCNFESLESAKALFSKSTKKGICPLCGK